MPKMNYLTRESRAIWRDADDRFIADNYNLFKQTSYDGYRKHWHSAGARRALFRALQWCELKGCTLAEAPPWAQPVANATAWHAKHRATAKSAP